MLNITRNELFKLFVIERLKDSVNEEIPFYLDFVDNKIYKLENQKLTFCTFEHILYSNIIIWNALSFTTEEVENLFKTKKTKILVLNIPTLTVQKQVTEEVKAIEQIETQAKETESVAHYSNVLIKSQSSNDWYLATHLNKDGYNFSLPYAFVTSSMDIESKQKHLIRTTLEQTGFSIKNLVEVYSEIIDGNSIVTYTADIDWTKPKRKQCADELYIVDWVKPSLLDSGFFGKYTKNLFNKLDKSL